MGIEPNLCKTCKQISRCDDCEKDIFQVGVTVQIKVIQNPGVLMWGRSLDPVLYDFFHLIQIFLIVIRTTPLGFVFCIILIPYSSNQPHHSWILYKAILLLENQFNLVGVVGAVNSSLQCWQFQLDGPKMVSIDVTQPVFCHWIAFHKSGPAIWFAKIFPFLTNILKIMWLMIATYNLVLMPCVSFMK